MIEPPEMASDWNNLSPGYGSGQLASDWGLSPNAFNEFGSDGDDLSPADFDEIAFIKELEERDGETIGVVDSAHPCCVHACEHLLFVS